MTRSATIAPLLLLAIACSESPAPGTCDLAPPEPADWRLHVDGTHLRDALDRIVILRGVNAGGRSKFAPYAPFDFAEGAYAAGLAEYLDRAQTWGIDALRVPFSWQALEPVQGRDDEDYLARYDALLDAAWARGMWTIVDFHQDVYAESLCGDGFPEWTLPEPRAAPHHDCPAWFLAYYGDDSVRAAFDVLWSDATGVRTALGAMWERMAARHADRPGVVGFELINEPGWGSATDVHTWEAEVLTPFVSELGTRVQTVAPETLVFFDSASEGSVVLSTGLSRPAGTGLVFAPHFYDVNALRGGEPSVSDVDEKLARWSEIGATWDLPILLGESGIDPDVTRATAYTRALYDALDELGMSFTFWEYSRAAEQWNEEDFSLVEGDGSETVVVAEVVRPYPRAVAGEAVEFHYDAAQRILTLAYDARPGITEVVVPARVFPEGVETSVSGACIDASREGLLLLENDPGAERVTLTVRPR